MARALFAAIAAVMITFSTDHSAAVGLSVFSGFAIATSLVWFLAVWLIFARGRRWPAATLGSLTLIAGLLTGIPSIRSDTLFFAVVISWALLTGVVEALSGWWMRRKGEASRGDARDALTVGILGVALGISLIAVPVQYALTYTIEAAGTFTLTGITIAVGVFGGYAAILAVYLGIAAFSPRPATETATTATSAEASS